MVLYINVFIIDTINKEKKEKYFEKNNN